MWVPWAQGAQARAQRPQEEALQEGVGAVLVRAQAQAQGARRGAGAEESPCELAAPSMAGVAEGYPCVGASREVAAMEMQCGVPWPVAGGAGRQCEPAPVVEVAKQQCLVLLPVVLRVLRQGQQGEQVLGQRAWGHRVSVLQA